MTGYSLALGLHIGAGSIALVTFWLNAALRKGGRWHRLVGRLYLLAMAVVIASGVPLTLARLAEGHPVTAAFLGYLFLLTLTLIWLMWRAVRDRQAPERFIGPVYVGLAVACIAAGAGILAIGLAKGAPLLIGFSLIGPFAGIDMLRSRARIARQPMWWREAHYGAMLGAGAATHVAFLSIGLPRLLPSVDGRLLHYVAWFGPVVAAMAAKVWLDRRYRRPARTAASPQPPALDATAASR